MDASKDEFMRYIVDTAHAITSSTYLTNRHLEQIVQNALNRVNQITHVKRWLLLYTYVREVFKMYLHKNSPLFDRRFAYFFHALTSELKMEYERLSPHEKEKCIHAILTSLIEDAEEENVPWPKLLMELSRHVEKKKLEEMYSDLSTTIDEKKASLNVIICWSYIALLADKEGAAHVILKRRSPHNEEDVLAHFELLKERERWMTIKHWGESLFPAKHRVGAILQPIFDEMTAALATNEREQKDIWERWLQFPSFSRFLTYTKYMQKEEKEKLFFRLLPHLEEMLHVKEAETSYVKLLLHFHQYERVADYFALYVHDPSRLRPEQQEWLSTLQTEQPELAIRVYHQFVIRLVVKKTRAHYKEAVSYLQRLQKLYEKTEQLDRFFDFIHKLKRHYRTYRAFVEELKRVES